jgi:hypothetical protein
MAVTVAQFDNADERAIVRERFEPYMAAQAETIYFPMYDKKLKGFKCGAIHERCHRGLANFRYMIRRCYMSLILDSGRNFCIAWIVVGVVCLLVGMHASNYIGPLFTTGQTWLGVSISISLKYFGVNKASNEKKSKSIVSEEEEIVFDSSKMDSKVYSQQDISDLPQTMSDVTEDIDEEQGDVAPEVQKTNDKDSPQPQHHPRAIADSSPTAANVARDREVEAGP